MKCLNCRVDCNVTSLLAGLLAGLLACWLAGWLTDVGGKWVGGMYNVCNVLYVRSGYYYDMMCTSFRGEGEGGLGLWLLWFMRVNKQNLIAPVQQCAMPFISAPLTHCQ